jgi:hypothetical protein
MSDKPQTPKHPLDADVTLSDGSVVRVAGLLAVHFQKDPDGLRRFIEDDIKKRKGAENV